MLELDLGTIIISRPRRGFPNDLLWSNVWPTDYPPEIPETLRSKDDSKDDTTANHIVRFPYFLRLDLLDTRI